MRKQIVLRNGVSLRREDRSGVQVSYRKKQRNSALSEISITNERKRLEDFDKFQRNDVGSATKYNVQMGLSERHSVLVYEASWTRCQEVLVSMSFAPSKKRKHDHAFFAGGCLGWSRAERPSVS